MCIRDSSVEAGERIAIGDKNEYEIGPPHGKNMLVYIFSPVPLDEGPRAQIESLETFLPTLERNLRAVERTGKKRGLLSRAVVLTTRG